MEATDKYEEITNYLSRQMDVPVESITNDTTFESLGIDSLDTVEMLMDLEQELNVDLELEEKLSTVGEFVAFVEERIG